jgi:putative acetyltransferase
LRIRPYAAADLDTLIALFRVSVRQAARRDYSPEQLHAWAPDVVDRAGWVLRLAVSQTWVAVLGEQALGFVSLEPDGHIDMLYVDAECQRRGVASALLDRVESTARAQGLGRLSTEASITARRFFEHRGFHVIEAQTTARRGVKLRNFRMARALP